MQNHDCSEIGRIIVLEHDVKTINNTLHGDDGISKRLRDVEKTVWKAIGAGSLLNLLTIIAIEVYRH